MPPEPPSKFVTETKVIDVRATLLHVDMDGLHDGQAIKTIISDLQPRQLVSLIDPTYLSDRPLTPQVLVRSSPEATQALTTFLASSSGPKEVYAPSTGQALQIGEHVQSYSFALGDSIASGLSAKWSKVGSFSSASPSI